MPEPTDQAVKPLRTWRPMVFWSAGILLALGLAWFVAAVVVPVWQVRTALPTPFALNWGGDNSISPWEDESFVSAENSLMRCGVFAEAVIGRLGGNEKAARKLKCYLRAPSKFAPRKDDAFEFLVWCGEPARPVILEAMQDPDPAMRRLAIVGITANGCGRHERSAGYALSGLFPDGDDATRAKATANLERLLSDNDEWVRSAAAEALRKIKIKRTYACDGRYAVLPWDTFPEFGKMKPVRFAEMMLEGGIGKIKISYQDGTNCCIDATVVPADKEFTFCYRFPVGTATRREDHVPLRRTKDFLEMHYLQTWVRFAKRLREGERIPYPGWGCRPQEVWGSGSATEYKQQ